MTFVSGSRAPLERGAVALRSAEPFSLSAN